MASSRQAVAAAVDALLGESPDIRVREVIERTGLSRHTVQRRLKDLVADGLLRLEGRGRGARYIPCHRHPRNETRTEEEIPEDAPRVFLGGAAEDLLSRAQARALLTGLEGARAVVLDFHGVDRIGLGFADELFRVWAGENPSSRLICEHTSPPVELAVQQARQSAPLLPAAPRRALPPARTPPLLSLSQGWTARLLELSRSQGHALLEVSPPAGGLRMRLELRGCREIRVPSLWTFSQPALETTPEGSLVLTDPDANVRIVFTELGLGARLTA